MKQKEKKDLHHKEKVELKKLLNDAKEALFSMKIDHSQFKLKNTASLSVKRKEIATILTVLRGKDLSEGSKK